MNFDQVADEVEHLQGRVTTDVIKSYCGRGSQSLRGNRPFPNYLWPLFQSESWCSSFHMKINFICM